ncbi:MAG: sulfur carrier protein ThiS [Deltaproteobacteria bacterium]|jgi:sulfur carrier protein|nr:sulfur carrier protein ThiS [Deltaproteobacteria bacterium]
MNLVIAGVNKAFDQGLTVSELLVLEKVQNPEYVTVALNDEFVDNPLESKKVLNDGDQVEFLYFMGGGQGLGLSPGAFGPKAFGPGQKF